jgi:DNA-binding FrmR family transcriptional regulator
MALDLAEQQRLTTRLNRIEGQVRGIKKMIDQRRGCLDIIQQLTAVEASLNRVSAEVFRSHVEATISDGAASEDPQERRQALDKIVQIFERFAG